MSHDEPQLPQTRTYIPRSELNLLFRLTLHPQQPPKKGHVLVHSPRQRLLYRGEERRVDGGGGAGRVQRPLKHTLKPARPRAKNRCLDGPAQQLGECDRAAEKQTAGRQAGSGKSNVRVASRGAAVRRKRELSGTKPSGQYHQWPARRLAPTPPPYIQTVDLPRPSSSALNSTLHMAAAFFLSPPQTPPTCTGLDIPLQAGWHALQTRRCGSGGPPPAAPDHY